MKLRCRMGLLAVLPFLCMDAGAQETARPVTWTNAFPALTFEQPLFLTAVPGTDRMAVVEQGGKIFTFENKAEVTSRQLMLDVGERIIAGGEQGLLGLAFDPGYASNGYIYLNYTAPDPLRTVIARFHVEDGVAKPASFVSLLEFDQPYSNHNGGMLAFGPDGFLYISAGDGGAGDDPHDAGQRLDTVLGKILRIRPLPGDLIPADNPFVGQDGARPEMWAYGLRNVWRFSFDRTTGELWAGDVGQNKLEEIDVIVRGGNYGWRIYEASRSNINPENRPAGDFIAPVWEYGRDAGICVTGGYVYRGKAVPGMVGKYIFGDFQTGRIWSLARSDEGGASVEEIGHVWTISSFGEDADGELYITSFSGNVYRMIGGR